MHNILNIAEAKKQASLSFCRTLNYSGAVGSANLSVLDENNVTLYSMESVPVGLCDSVGLLLAAAYGIPFASSALTVAEVKADATAFLDSYEMKYESDGAVLAARHEAEHIDFRLRSEDGDVDYYELEDVPLELSGVIESLIEFVFNI